MTVPQDYMLAQQRFDKLLVDLMEALDLTTRHQVYAVLFAVLTVFRRRLDADQTLIFANALPPLLRAMFVAGWHQDRALSAWASDDRYDEEARAVRKDHNLMPNGSFKTVSTIIRAQCNRAAFETALANLPAEARAFWQ